MLRNRQCVAVFSDQTVWFAGDKEISSESKNGKRIFQHGIEKYNEFMEAVEGSFIPLPECKVTGMTLGEKNYLFCFNSESGQFCIYNDTGSKVVEKSFSSWTNIKMDHLVAVSADSFAVPVGNNEINTYRLTDFEEIDSLKLNKLFYDFMRLESGCFVVYTYGNVLILHDTNKKIHEEIPMQTSHYINNTWKLFFPMSDNVFVVQTAPFNYGAPFLLVDTNDPRVKEGESKKEKESFVAPLKSMTSKLSGLTDVIAIERVADHEQNFVFMGKPSAGNDYNLYLILQKTQNRICLAENITQFKMSPSGEIVYCQGNNWYKSISLKSLQAYQKRNEPPVSLVSMAWQKIFGSSAASQAVEQKNNESTMANWLRFR